MGTRFCKLFLLAAAFHRESDCFIPTGAIAVKASPVAAVVASPSLAADQSSQSALAALQVVGDDVMLPNGFHGTFPAQLCHLAVLDVCRMILCSMIVTICFCCHWCTRLLHRIYCECDNDDGRQEDAKADGHYLIHGECI